MIIPVFSRQRIAAHTLVAMSIVATGFISFGLWVHHMFTTGLPDVSLSFFSAASTVIAIPSGIQVFAWISTIAAGRPVYNESEAGAAAEGIHSYGHSMSDIPNDEESPDRVDAIRA